MVSSVRSDIVWFGIGAGGGGGGAGGGGGGDAHAASSSAAAASTETAMERLLVMGRSPLKNAYEINW
jgi:hypothetical protein